MTIHELSGSWGELRVAELGGCVLSWRPAGHDDVLFLSERAELVPGTMWHGGIPVCAPWFGCGQGDWDVPHGHGLVARVPWRTELAKSSDEGATVVLTLTSAEVAHLPGAGRYPDDLTYRLSTTADSAALTVELTISSPTRETGVDQAFHPYLRIDASQAVITGLQGVAYRDPLQDWAPGCSDEPLAIDGHTDLVFDGAPPLFLSDGEHTRRLTSRGAQSTVVWCAGPQNTDLAAGEWERFVCVENGNVRDRAVTIPAGGEHLLRMTIEV